MTRFVSALRRAPYLRITGERQRLLASFAAVFLFGLLAHGYAFTNFTVSHDSLNEMFLSGDIRYAAGSVAGLENIARPVSLSGVPRRVQRRVPVRRGSPAFSRSCGYRLRCISFRGCSPWTTRCSLP